MFKAFYCKVFNMKLVEWPPGGLIGLRSGYWVACKRAQCDNMPVEKCDSYHNCMLVYNSKVIQLIAQHNWIHEN